MSEDQPIDWLHSSNAERQLLYRTVDALVISGAASWNEFLKSALGRIPSEHYLENFRRGLNSRKDCVRLYNYLAGQFPEHARHLLASRPRISRVAPWRDVEGATEGADLRAVDVRFANNRQAIGLRVAHLSFGDRFCLELTSPFDGYAIVFRQGAKGWHLMPLPRELIVPVHQGRQWLGQSSESTALPSFDGSDHEEVFHLRALIGDRDLAEDFALKLGSVSPIPTRSLRSIPAKLRASASAWSVAHTWVSVMPRFNQDPSAR
jgi:hypothetical protein